MYTLQKILFSYTEYRNGTVAKTTLNNSSGAGEGTTA